MLKENEETDEGSVLLLIISDGFLLFIYGYAVNSLLVTAKYCSCNFHMFCSVLLLFYFTRAQKIEKKIEFQTLYLIIFIWFKFVRLINSETKCH